MQSYSDNKNDIQKGWRIMAISLIKKTFRTWKEEGFAAVCYKTKNKIKNIGKEEA